MEVNVAPYLTDGYQREVVSRYERYEKVTNEGSSGPFGLKMVQIIYHSGKLSTQASGLMQIAPNTGRLGMNPEDLERLGLSEGGRVRVTSDHGSVELGVQPDLSALPGSCTFPEHFNDPPVKDLMTVAIDPVTGVPYFKLTKVTLEKI